MTAKLSYRWHLREVMASRGMFSTSALRPLLVERGITLSVSQVYRLVTETPERLSLKILMALLDILDCSMTDLIEPTVAGGRGWVAKAVGGADAGIGELRAKRVLRDLSGDEPAVVQGLPETASPLRRLWPRRPDPRWHPDRTAVRNLHPPRRILLAVLPDLRTASTQHPIMHPLQSAASTTSAAGRRPRRGSHRTARPARQPDQPRPTSRGAGVAEQDHHRRRPART